MVSALKYLEAMDFCPLILAYMLMRASLRFFLGRGARNRILGMINMETLGAFLERIRYPEYLILSLLVKESEARIQRSIFRHEPRVTSLALSKKGAVFVDVGANVGYYSFLLHGNFETILAVEPHPDNVRIMSVIKSEKNYSKVKILPFAVGDEDRDEIELYFGSHCGGHTLSNSRGSSPPGNQQEYIRTKMVTLNTLLKNYASIDLVKVDVEGAEWLVLQGANNASSKIKSWIIEVHGLRKKEEIEKWFSDRSYRYKWIDKNHMYAERN